MVATARSPARLAAIALAGAVLGAAALLIAQLPHPIDLLGTLGGPWIATAFAVGTFARRRGPGRDRGRRRAWSRPSSIDERTAVAEDIRTTVEARLPAP